MKTILRSLYMTNTDNTDFTDSSVLPHNGTKEPFLVFPIKRIRVIREIRVQNPYASRLKKS